MSEHTPGPWEEDPEFPDAIGAGPKHIAMVNCFHSGDEREVWGEEYRANIRLITAAPSLLDACQWLMECVDDWMENGNECPNCRHHYKHDEECPYSVCKAAVAKVIGVLP